MRYKSETKVKNLCLLLTLFLIFVFSLFSFCLARAQLLEQDKIGNSEVLKQNMVGKSEVPSSLVMQIPLPQLDKMTNIISASFKGVEISEVIKFLMEKVDESVVTSPSIKGKISVDFKKIPLKDAIMSVLKAGRVYLVYDDNSFKVLTLEEYSEYVRKYLREVRVFDVGLVSMNVVRNMLGSILTPGIGEVIVDENNNKVIVSDIKQNFQFIEDAIEKVRKSSGLVMIRAKIIQISKNDGLDYGFDLKLDNIIKSLTFSFSGTSSPNLSSGILGISTLSGGGNFGIEDGSGLREVYIGGVIKALSSLGTVKIISSPKVLCNNGEEANILIGDKIPYIKAVFQSSTGTIGSATSQVEFIDVGIKLQVKPRITENKEIKLKINLQISSHKFVDLGFVKSPQITTTESTTEVTCKNGVPIIIGGLENNNTTFQKEGLPFLKDIPILGDILFSHISKAEGKSVIVILLIPELVDFNVPHNVIVDEGKVEVNETPESNITNQVLQKEVTEEKEETKSVNTNSMEKELSPLRLNR